MYEWGRTAPEKHGPTCCPATVSQKCCLLHFPPGVFDQDCSLKKEENASSCLLVDLSLRNSDA